MADSFTFATSVDVTDASKMPDTRAVKVLCFPPPGEIATHVVPPGHIVHGPFLLRFRPAAPLQFCHREHVGASRGQRG
jgi:hypothetical protein